MAIGDVQKNILQYADYIAEMSGVQTAVFDFISHAFLPEKNCAYCADCRFCDYHTAHRYGCFEAERWDGLFIYHCPAGLTFIATLAYEQERAAYGLISGPLLLGAREDIALPDGLSIPADLPTRKPREATAHARVQKAVCLHISGREEKDSAGLYNTLYDLGLEAQEGSGYPLEIENTLRRMIAQGDREGAKDLINTLLGKLYFGYGGDFERIREQARALIVLFSRASIDGGADSRRIFGDYPEFTASIDRCRTLDELSDVLISLFYRFVGYAFDFADFAHADIMHKTMRYVQDNLAGKISLEEAAAQAGISRGYLSSIFKEELGMSFTDYVNERRIERGKELLRRRQLSIADIAAMTGYSDQSYFTKVFLRFVGQSPGQYRKKLLGREEI